MGFRGVLGLVQGHTAMKWRGLGFLTLLPVVSPLAHPVSFIQQILMVTGVFLMHRSGGGINEGHASLRTAAMIGGDSSSLQGRGMCGLPTTLCLLESGHWASSGPSPGALGTHHWGRRCF